MCTVVTLCVYKALLSKRIGRGLVALLANRLSCGSHRSGSVKFAHLEPKSPYTNDDFGTNPLINERIYAAHPLFWG